MKKNLLKIIGTVLSLILGFSSTVTAQETTTETEKVVAGGVYRSWELKAGMKIALQDATTTNGNQWLSATENNFKSGAFNDGCVFVIEAANTNGKFVLKHENQYIAAATAVENDPITFTPDKSAAAEFTFSCPTNNDFINDDTKQWPDDGFDYNNNMFVRLTTTYDGGNTYLNTNSRGLKPKFHNGTQGFSAWLVYSVGTETDYSKCSKAKETPITDLSALTNETNVMFKDVETDDGGARKGWIFEGENNTIFTTQYEPTNSLNSARYIWTVNVVEGGYTFTNKATGRVMRFDNSGDTGRTNNTNILTKDGDPGTFTIENGATGTWFIKSNGQYFNGIAITKVPEGTSGFTTWSTAHDYEIYPVIMHGADVYSVTIQYVNKKGEPLQAEETEILKPGDSYTFSAPSITNYTISSYKIGEQTFDTETSSAEISSDVIIKYVYDFTGFKTTTIENGEFKDPTWYQLRVRKDDSKKYLKYNSSNTIIDLISSGDLELADDAQLWCFSGSVEEGFKIYNKQAGPTLGISYSTEYGANGAKHAIMGDANLDVAIWNIAQSEATTAAGLSNGFCFTTTHATDANKYLNQRETFMSYWNDASEGSTFVVTDVTEELKELDQTTTTAFNEALSKAKQYTIGSELGQFNDASGEFTTALEEANSGMPTNIQTRTALTEKLTEATNALVINKPATGKFYRFKSIDGKYIQSFTENGTGRPKMVDEATDKTTVFFLSGDNSLTGCNALNIESREFTTNSGKAFTFVASQAVIGRYTITCTGDEEFSSSSWHKGTGTPLQLDRLTNGATDEACAWTIEEVTDLDQQPNLSKSIGTTGYATLGAPVALNIPDGVKAYTVTVSEDKTTATLEEIPGDVIPAGCGVILEKTDGNNSYTFTFAAGADAIEGNYLVPQYTNSDIAGTTNAYVFADINSELGFYQLHPDNRTISANKAYLVLPAEASNIRSIIIGGPTTGIEDTVTNGHETEEYYDLQGRRVLNPTKGIYVTKSGKKVIINK